MFDETFANATSSEGPDFYQSFREPDVPSMGRIDLGYNSSHHDAIYRDVQIAFVATETQTDIAFQGIGLQAFPDETWGIDNVVVRFEPVADCNTNSVPDSCDIENGTSLDCNTNGVPDECEADFDGDGTIDGCDPDIDNDGVDNADDVCDFTPTILPANLIEPDGSVLGDLDGDCDVDLIDYALMQERFTGPNPIP